MERVIRRGEDPCGRPVVGYGPFGCILPGDNGPRGRPQGFPPPIHTAPTVIPRRADNSPRIGNTVASGGFICEFLLTMLKLKVARERLHLFLIFLQLSGNFFL